ncbi:12475_t:CDS:2, partial [Dentiscutata erythropus]
MSKKHNTRSQKRDNAQITPDDLEPLNNNNSNNRHEKSEEEPLSILSYDSISLHSPSYCSSKEQIEMVNKLHQNKNYKQTMLNRSLEVQNIKILVNNTDLSDNTNTTASWVWEHMKKNKLKQEITCDAITLNLDGIEKKCGRLFSIKTSTTHLGEHLNSIHRIFSSQQYKKNSNEQTIIESDKSISTILSLFSKMDNHKPAKQQRILSRLVLWMVEDCQALKNSEWSLLGDENSELESDDSSELSTQSEQLKKNSHLSIVELIHAVKHLAKSLSCHPESQQKKDGQSLNKRLLLEEEWKYPTLGMMLPTISLLLSHLHQINESINSFKIKDVCEKIEDSITKHWKFPLIEAYIASYLDPR